MKRETIEIQAGLGVAVLWLNRPDVRNAFNDTMIAELTAAFGELEKDPAVRAVVLAGRGKAFCAGADLIWMQRMGELDFEANRLDATVNAILGELVQGAPGAHAVTKDLIHAVAGRRVDSGLMDDMATRIATARASAEGREGVRAFLEKRKPGWLQQAMKKGAKKKK